MTIFLKEGNVFRAASEEALDVHPKLPPGNYVLKVDINGFFFETVESFEMPPKLYGETTKHTDRIYRTFMSRPGSTGVLLFGEKGSGKTLLAKHLSLHAETQGLPTIIINTAFEGDNFSKLIQDINQPCIILFDEFEKVYNDKGQEAMLTLLDGVFPSKKLFILTCNDQHKINQHMINRPGRVFYKICYGGLSQQFIREYCEDNLADKSYIEQIVKLTVIFWKFNFDMLKAIVEEMNRYDESPQQALGLLNIQAENDRGNIFEFELFIDGVRKRLYRDSDYASPLMKETELHWYEAKNKEHKDRTVNGSMSDSDSSDCDEDDDDDDDETLQRICFTPGDVQTVSTDGQYVFVKDNARLVLTKPKPKTYSYTDYL